VPQTYLGDLAGVRVILADGSELQVSDVLNFGAGISAIYNSAQKRIDIDVAGGGSGRYVIQDGTDAATAAQSNVVLRMPTLTASRTVTLPASPTNGDFVRIRITNG